MFQVCILEFVTASEIMVEMVHWQGYISRKTESAESEFESQQLLNEVNFKRWFGHKMIQSIPTL